MKDEVQNLGRQLAAEMRQRREQYPDAWAAAVRLCWLCEKRCQCRRAPVEADGVACTDFLRARG